MVRVNGRDQQYVSYLDKHISNVKLVWSEVLRPIVESDYDEDFLKRVDQLISEHDEPKYSEEEWEPYLDYFYPDEDNPKDKAEVDRAFKYAVLHHYNHSPHHWNYWLILDEDMGEMEALDVPDEHVLCMLCDWASFRYGQKTAAKVDYPTTIGWYNDTKDNMILTDATQALISKYIEQLP